MQKRYQTALASIIAITTVIASAGFGNAQQSQTPHPFKSASISWNPEGGTPSVPEDIEVGHNGDRYTHMQGKFETRFRVKAKVKLNHRILGFVLATTDPTNLTDAVDEQIRSAAEKHVGAEVRVGDDFRTIDRSQTFSLDAVNAHNGFSFEQQVVSMCNDAHPELPTENVSVNSGGITVFAGFSAKKRNALVQAGGAMWDSGHGRPAIAFTGIPINIVCIGKPAPRSAGLPPERARPKPVSVDLRVEQHGETCPKSVTVKAYADYKSPVTATMRMLGMGTRAGPIRKVKTRKVEAFGKVWHRAETEFKYTMDPGEKTFKLRVDGNADAQQTVAIDCPPFKVTSAWLKYEVVEAGICPKQIVETATFRTTRPGWVDYVIKHQSGLPAWQDRLTAKRSGSGYSATHVRKFTLGEFNSQFMADVRNSPANSGWVGLKVDCPVVAAITGATDEKNPRRPEAERAPRETIVKTAPDSARQKVALPGIAPQEAVTGKPPRRVKPAAKPTCRGGRLVRASSSPTVYRCLCSQGNPRKVRKGWLCPAKIAPQAVKPQAAKPLCKGGVIRSGKCVCRPNRKLVKGACLANTVGKQIKARTVTKTLPAIRRKALTGEKRVNRRKKNGKTRLPALRPIR